MTASHIAGHGETIVQGAGDAYEIRMVGQAAVTSPLERGHGRADDFFRA